MVALPDPPTEDPTLEAALQTLAAKENAQPRRRYLGMSSIGEKCWRKLWYGMYAEQDPLPIEPKGFLAINDGHRGEDVVAGMLQATPGITLVTVEPGTTEQIRCYDLDGKYSGGLDGMILGLKQAPKTWHVWENKVVNERKFNKLISLKAKLGEKRALEEWDYTYYCQAVEYMHYEGVPRHYLTVATPGVRSLTSCRTEHNPVLHAELRSKADKIINSSIPPAKLSDRPDWHECKWCRWRHVCHGVMQ